MKNNMKKGKLTYEEAIAELGNIVEKMESDQVKITEVKGLLARANELMAFCRNELEGYGKEFESLMEEKQF